MAQAKEPAITEHISDLTKMLEQFKVPGIDMAALIEARRSDIAALTRANKVAYEGMQELVRKQAEILHATFEELRVAAGELAEGGKPAALGEKPKEFVEQAIRNALTNMRELAELAVKTQSDAFSIISKRALENVAEIKKVMHPH
jgi:phasin family protein